jgi:hypothetical protein
MKRPGGLADLPPSKSLKLLGDPYLDQRLLRNPQAFCLDIQAVDHSGREIHRPAGTHTGGEHFRLVRLDRGKAPAGKRRSTNESRFSTPRSL